MPFPAQKYSPEQKQAVIRAVVDDKQQYKPALKAASEGLLYGQEPFDMPLQTAYKICRLERQRRQGSERHPIAREDDLKNAARKSLRNRISIYAEEAEHEAGKKRGKRDLERLSKIEAAEERLWRTCALVEGWKLANPGGPKVSNKQKEAEAQSESQARADGSSSFARSVEKAAKEGTDPLGHGPTESSTNGVSGPRPRTHVPA